MKLHEHEKLLLEALKAGLQGGQASWDGAEEACITELSQLARNHKVLPVVYQAVSGSSDLDLSAIRRQATVQVARQTQMSQGALAVYDHMVSRGLHPLILKGAVCRWLYPVPDCRISGDEDLYIPAREFEPGCDALTEMGLTPRDDKRESWIAPGRSVHIELHRDLFVSPHLTEHSLEELFAQGFSETEVYEVEPGRLVCSFSPHLHFLYLILHAYKHFLFSGFGIRQICDVGLWVKQYCDRIDWERLYRECDQVHALYFAAAVFQIARGVLGISFELPAPWENVDVDPEPLLRDVLDAGIYGSATSVRLHSAVAMGGKAGNPIRTLFPDKEYMMSKYPQCSGREHMLPLMWARRLGEYGIEVLKKKEDPFGSVALAKKRQKLLRLYKVI